MVVSFGWRMTAGSSLKRATENLSSGSTSGRSMSCTLTHSSFVADRGLKVTVLVTAKKSLLASGGREGGERLDVTTTNEG